MSSEIVINDVRKVEEIKKRIIHEGPDSFHVLADFDLTLTKAFLEGSKSKPIMAYLRNGEYISSEYAQKAHDLYDKYHPFEIDDSLSVDEKTTKMKEWWNAHFNLLIESGLTRDIIEQMVEDTLLEFREGVSTFLKLLNENNIPLIIISSTGLGDSINLFLKKHNFIYNNIHIISNCFNFDSKGKVIGVKEPIIHSMNKSEVSLSDLPALYNLIKNRKNVLLLGDSLSDLGMIEGFDYSNLLSIGFLNVDIEERLQNYSENFNIVITNDGSFDYVNKFIKELVRE